MSDDKNPVEKALDLCVYAPVGAALYVRTLVNLVRINPGFATENLLLFRLNPRAAGYRGERTVAFHEDVQRALTRATGGKPSFPRRV